MIKIFGRQPFFKFHHYIYEYDLGKKAPICKLSFEKISGDLKKIDIGYFSIRMLESVLNRNPDLSECFVFYSTDRSKIIGFALLSFIGAKEIHYKIKSTDAFITALGVFPDERGKGYSQEILRGVVWICKSRGLNNMKLSVDSNNGIAINAYEKFGFVKCQEKKFVRIASIDLLFAKSL